MSNNSTISAQQAENPLKYDDIVELFGFFDNSRYKKNKHIADGGHGSVTEYYDQKTFRTIVFKSLNDSECDKEKISFIKEALITASLEHPSIVPIHEISLDENGAPIYMMKKLNGQSLSRIISDIRKGKQDVTEKYPLTTLLQVFLKICDAVAYAHSLQILHLDIKPENIIIGEFGDVLLMDWGIAEHFGAEFSNDNIRRIFECFCDNKFDDHIHGSPGYMAPEQITHGLEFFDERTDIHGLGALLYTILTLRSAYAGNNVMEVLENTRVGNFASPVEYTAKRAIPKELAAISVKAIATDKHSRYRVVDELKSDIDNFLLGYAVSALKDTWVKKLNRFYRRYRNYVNYAFIVFFFCILTFAVSYTQYLKTQGSWKTSLDIDLSDPEAVRSNLFQVAQYVDGHKEIPATAIDENGLSPGYNRIYIGQPDNPVDYIGDVKIELEFEWGSAESVNGIEVCFNAELQPDKTAENEVLKGYSVQIGAWTNQFNNLSRNYRQGPPNLINSIPFTYPGQLRNTLTIERRHPHLYVYLNDKKILEEESSQDFYGRPFGKIRFRNWDKEVKFKHLKVMTQKRAQLVSPLDVGDVLTTINNYEAAAREYLKVIKDIPVQRTKVAAAKKYIQTLYVLAEEGNYTKKDLSKALYELNELFWDDSLDHFQVITEAGYYWRTHNYSRALHSIKQVPEPEEQGMLAQSLLLEKHFALDERTGVELLTLLAQKKDIRFLDLSNLNLSTLHPLKNLKLQILKCSGNNISDLSPLKGMPLINLIMKRNRIEDLSPLKDAPLRQLVVDNNPLRVIPEFTRKKLEICFAQSTGIKDVGFLKGHPLRTLNISNTPVESLEPLDGVKTLLNLTLDRTDVTDLSPAKNSRIRHFFVRGSYSSHKKAITGLEQVNLSEVQSFAVSGTDLNYFPDLSKAGKLGRLTLTHNEIKNLDTLAQLPRSKRFEILDLSGNIIEDASALRGLTVDSLNMSHNKIKDFSFLDTMTLLHTPLRYSANLSPEQIELFAEKWDKYNIFPYSRKTLKIMAHIQRKEFDKLRNYSSKINGKQYLYVRVNMSFDKAQSLARAAGGELICYETREEYERVIRHGGLSLRGNNYFTGLEMNSDGALQWVSGIPLNWELPDLQIHSNTTLNRAVFDTKHIERRFRMFQNILSDELYFVIEFN